MMNGFRRRVSRRAAYLSTQRKDRNLIKGKATESGLYSPGCCSLLVCGLSNWQTPVPLLEGFPPQEQ